MIGGTGVLGGELVRRPGPGRGDGRRRRPQRRTRQRARRGDREARRQGDVRRVDAADRESVQALLDTVVKQHGRVDALVNCAGVNSPTPYFDISDEEFDRIVNTNLLATHLGCQIFGKHMVDAGGGAILNIGSVTSYRPLSRVFIYSASKAAVLNLTQNVAREFAPHGVRVNCLCPGFFPAEQNRKILDKTRVESILRHTPMGRLGDAPELIGAALLLLSPVAGSFITGEAIYVDGGFTAMTI